MLAGLRARRQGVLAVWSNYYKPDYVLPPKHAQLFGAALSYLSDEVGWKTWQGDDSDGGNTPFARLTQGQ